MITQTVHLEVNSGKSWGNYYMVLFKIHKYYVLSSNSITVNISDNWRNTEYSNYSSKTVFMIEENLTTSGDHTTGACNMASF